MKRNMKFCFWCKAPAIAKFWMPKSKAHAKGDVCGHIPLCEKHAAEKQKNGVQVIYYEGVGKARRRIGEDHPCYDCLSNLDDVSCGCKDIRSVRFCTTVCKCNKECLYLNPKVLNTNE